MIGSIRQAAGGVALVATACGGDDATVVVVAHPPALRVESLQPAGGPAWQPGRACVERGRDAAGSVAVRIGPSPEGGRVTQLDSWTLRPPLGCGQSVNCGYLRLEVGPPGTEAPLVVEGASTHLIAPLATVPLGATSFQVGLRDALGRVVLGSDGNPAATRVDLTLAPPGACP